MVPTNCLHKTRGFAESLREDFFSTWLWFGKGEGDVCEIEWMWCLHTSPLCGNGSWS